MRKVIKPDTLNEPPQSQDDWRDVEGIATVEVTSYDPVSRSILALAAGKGFGWHVAAPGKEIIRIVSVNLRPPRRIKLEFFETDVEQKITLRWSEADGPFREIVGRRWNFSLHGSTN